MGEPKTTRKIVELGRFGIQGRVGLKKDPDSLPSWQIVGNEEAVQQFLAHQSEKQKILTITTERSDYEE